MDYRARYHANEGLIFFGFGLTENIAVEFEAAMIGAWFRKSPADTSALPLEIRESALGDVEGQIRWRWRKETERRPELFSYTEFVVPHAKDKVLIGTPGVELKFGAGLIRGFGWGTLTARAAVEYSEASSSPWDLSRSLSRDERLHRPPNAILGRSGRRRGHRASVDVSHSGPRGCREARPGYRRAGELWKS